MTRLPDDRESTIQHSAIVQLGSLGIELWRRNVGVARFRNQPGGKERFVRFAYPGQSDLYGTDWPSELLWGRPWEIETKRRGKRPTLSQEIWLRNATRRGCVAFWGDNIDTIVRVAKAILAGGRIVWKTGPDFDVEMS